MRILECPLLKNKIALGCIGLLGLSTFSGLMHTSASSGFFSKLSTLFSRFGARGAEAATQESGTQGKISPARWVAKTGKEVWDGYLTPFVKTTYEWAKTQDKRESVWKVLKEFWSYSFFKGLIKNSPWIVRDWIYILAHSEVRSKFLLAWKYTLAFFNHVVNKPDLKTYISSFSKIFAELLFVPSLAIRKFVKRSEGGQTTQCPSNDDGRGDSVSQGETKICISVTRSESK